jgi:hypothetical protein
MRLRTLAKLSIVSPTPDNYPCGLALVGRPVASAPLPGPQKQDQEIEVGGIKIGAIKMGAITIGAYSRLFKIAQDETLKRIL